MRGVGQGGGRRGGAGEGWGRGGGGERHGAVERQQQGAVETGGEQ